VAGVAVEVVILSNPIVIPGRAAARTRNLAP
jgi:hypothetical protein